jgi:hypothetical protein
MDPELMRRALFQYTPTAPIGLVLSSSKWGPAPSRAALRACRAIPVAVVAEAWAFAGAREWLICVSPAMRAPDSPLTHIRQV